MEEALLRTHEDNWVILNEGSPPAVVMGLSTHPSSVIEEEAYKKNPVPIIRRYSGGGTVVVDDSTLFVSFIFRHDFGFDPYPANIMEWTAKLYEPHLPFTLQENDYTLGNLKVGGNAQYIRKNRWSHHTTFLWDYDPSLMSLLKHPPKMPAYREDRPHSDFITTLKNHLSKEKFFTAVENALSSFGTLEFVPFEALPPFPHHRKSTTLLKMP